MEIKDRKIEYPWNLIEKGCPWCLSVELDIKCDDLYQIECKECGSRGPFGHTKEQAIKSWNKGIKQ